MKINQGKTKNGMPKSMEMNHLWKLVRWPLIHSININVDNELVVI